LEAIIGSRVSINKVQVTQDRSMELICILDVINAKFLDLEKFHSTAKVSASGLKELYCVSDVYGTNRWAVKVNQR
jgi:hypothetical protein